MYLDAYPSENFEGIVEHISYELKLLNNINVYGIRIKPLKNLRLLNKD